MGREESCECGGQGCGSERGESATTTALNALRLHPQIKEVVLQQPKPPALGKEGDEELVKVGGSVED
jgi:hypothetical protein